MRISDWSSDVCSSDLLAMKSVNGARVYVAAMCAGMMAGSLAMALAYTGARQIFGKTVVEHQGMRWVLGAVATDREALRALTAKAGMLYDKGGDAVVAAAHAKGFAGRVAGGGGGVRRPG